MPTKFFYGHEHSSLQPAEVLQSSIPLPQHFNFSRFLPRIRVDARESPTNSHAWGSKNQGVPAPRLPCEQGSLAAVSSKKNLGAM